MRKAYFFLSFLLMAGLHAAAQTTLAQWNFNSSFTIPANGTAPGPSSGVSTGTISLTGGVNGNDVAGVNADPGTPNRALNTLGYPAQGTNPKMSGIQIQVNTAGYNSVHLKFYVQHSATAAKKVVVQYFNGTTWQDVTTYTYLANNISFSALQDVDLSAFAPINDNVAAQIRLVTDFSLGNMYEGATSTYGTSGTIHYDLVTITGNPNNCIGPATVQASGFRLLKSDATSAQLTLNRGNGMGCLVVCSQAGIPSAPANGSNYAANPSFGAGAVVGNGFAVFNTWASNLSIQYFNINNLVAGTKYYVAAYEYSNGSFCYLSPGYVDSFYCNSTVLYPGDVQFIGYDNSVSVANVSKDAFALTNLKPLTTGTSFQIVNSRYEAGAPANTRTNKWYAGNNDINQPLQRITVTYTGPSLAAGSVIGFEHSSQSSTNLKINGAATNDLSITDNFTISNLLSSTAAEQFYVTQGKFTAYNLSGTDKYSLLDGHVLHGISYGNPWVDFSLPCSAGNTNADRTSRIPTDINCIRLFFFGLDGFGYYQTTPPYSGSQGLLISQINTLNNWTFGDGTNGNNIAPAVYTTTFNPTGNTPAGNWTGTINNNWFNCNNWEGRFVPDSTTDATIPLVTYAPEINANVQLAAEYNKQATARALTINGGAVKLNGNAADKIVIYDSLLISNTGSFTTTSGTDTVIVRGNLQVNTPANFQLATNGWLSLEGNRLLQPISVSLASATPTGVYAIAINNGPGIRILNGGFESIQQLLLTNGILSTANGNAFHYIGPACTISSPTFNKFGETRGYEKSYIDGKVYVKTNGPNSYIAPIGNAAKDIFAPMGFTPNNDAVARTYLVSYIPTSHPNVSPADVSTPPLDRVSKGEYWTITSDISTNPAAKITLYYTPYSRVGGGGNNVQALKDLRIAQYWDSSQYSTYKWRLYGTGATGNYNTSGFDTNYGKISYSEYATDLRPMAQNFTIGTISAFNILPVQLLNWKAMAQGKRVQLNWKVADETMVLFYTIEKSTDGVHFTSIQTIHKSGGNGNYTNYDDNPINGWNYYRLKAIGTDGKIFYSVIERVWNTSLPQFAVYPNPATDVLWLQLPAAGMVTLYTPDGRMIMQRRLPALSSNLNIKSFAKGMYIVEYFDGRKRVSEKIRFQ